MERKRKYDLTGHRFGLLVAKEPTRDSAGKSAWVCRCDCGKSVIIETKSLTRKRGTKSCGCVQARQCVALVDCGTNPARINSDKLNKNNQSGYKGVSFNSRAGKWVACIYFQRKKYFLGYHTRKTDAIAARKQAEDNLHKPFLEWYYGSEGEPGRMRRCPWDAR